MDEYEIPEQPHKTERGELERENGESNDAYDDLRLEPSSYTQLSHNTEPEHIYTKLTEPAYVNANPLTSANEEVLSEVGNGPETHVCNRSIKVKKVVLSLVIVSVLVLCGGLLIFFMASNRASNSKDPPVIQRNIPLGIENGKISDVAMSSSSNLKENSLPHFARLRNQRPAGCAWMPAKTTDSHLTWLQIDLGRLTNVSAVATQGHCSSKVWTKSYVIMYSKDGANWTDYGEMGTTKILTGNTDSTSVVTNDFNPFTARFVRISPRSWQKNAALRIELFTNSPKSPASVFFHKPRSCLDHLKNGLKTNGYYSIYDASSILNTVYCDMTSERGKAWTLVLSFALKHNSMTEFQNGAFSLNLPVDRSLPNWEKYRMDLTMMTDLRTQSTHWRATCSFPTYGVDYVDYVRGEFTSLHILTFTGSNKCERVEYVNIRGHNCSDCKLPWWHNVLAYEIPSCFLHTDSTYTTCGFSAKEGSTFKEDNFGFYKHINRMFRCTESSSATTNWWFGGKFVKE